MTFSTSNSAVISLIGNPLKSFNQETFESVIQGFITASSSASSSVTFTLDVSNTGEFISFSCTFDIVLTESCNFVSENSVVVSENYQRASGPYDCTAGSCGSFSWWVALNATAQGYINFGSGSTAAKCSDGTPIYTSTLTPLICKCPTYATDIAPCVCGATSGSNTTSTITCASQSLDDGRMAAVIAKIDSTTPLDTFNLNNNKLMKIPDKLAQYNQLASVKLANNSITSIGSNDLSTLTANVK